MKRSKFIAVLMVGVMMFCVVQPVFAKDNRTWGEVGEEAKDWGMWGAIIGGVVVVGSIIATGGAALPVYIGAGLGGAAVGGGIGATAGAIGQEGREKVTVAASVIALIASGGEAGGHTPAPAK